MLFLSGVSAAIGDAPILNNISLSLKRGEVHFVMGPNGSGKSTLVRAIMGDPAVRITAGRIIFEGEDISRCAPEERARRGIFAAFQDPVEVPGVGMVGFLRNILASRGVVVPAETAFRRELASTVAGVGMAEAFIDRNLNEGFSGGEKKRSEIFQMQVLKPKLALLDEFDSGLDVDGIRTICEAILEVPRAGRALLVVTHSGRIAEHFAPDCVHIMARGRIVQSGGAELVAHIEKNGFSEYHASD